jgi:Na+-translocating ferredoxin:NAD+ oxidoreductase RNF subunit RnfB
MWAEPASRYWVIRLPAEITGHLIVRAHSANINRDAVNLVEVSNKIRPEKDCFACGYSQPCSFFY